MKKVLFIILAMAVAMVARAGNVVTLPTVTGAPGQEVEVAVSLDNDAQVSAMQLQVPVTDAIGVVAGSEALSDRAAAHSATVGIKEGVLNIMVYSIDMAALSANSGEVLRFKVKLGDEPTTIPLQCSRLTLTDCDGNPVEGTTVSGSISILAAKARLTANSIDFGHVPIRSTYHKTLSVQNVGTATLVLNGIDPTAAQLSCNTTFPLSIAPGNSGSVDITYAPTERGGIDENVRLLSNNIDGNNTVRVFADPYAVNELHVEDATGYADSTITVHLRMNNMDAISGFQIEFDMPKQLEYVDGSFALSDRSNGHAVTVTCNNSKLVAIAYSLTDGTFAGEDGELASFDVKISGRNSVYLQPSRAVLTTTYKGKDMDVTSATYRGYIRIYSPTLSASTTLSMGATPVTTVAKSSISIRNSGSAPLTLSRVDFDKEGFTVTNAMPLTIANGKSVNLNIEYNGLTEAEFSTIMNIYSNDPDHRLHAVTVTGSRFAPNYLEFSAADVVNDANLAVDINIDTYDPIDGMQFDITYPADWFTPNGEFAMTDRAASFSVAEREIEPGVVRCFLYSLTDGKIEAGTGKIGTIVFANAPAAPSGQYSLKISNIKLGTSDLNDKYAGKDLQCQFKVKHFIRGDVDNDGEVDVADINCIINIMMGQVSLDKYDHRDDVDGDGEVDVADINRIINIMMGYASYDRYDHDNIVVAE